MGWSRHNSRQGTLDLPVAMREPTRDELYAAYQFCIKDKERLSFERALTMPAIAVTIKTLAKAAILRRGGV